MAHINFIIPQSKAELLSENDEHYFVRNVVSLRELQPKLAEAKLCLKDEGPEFILDNFDTFYSVLHHVDSIQMDVLLKAYEYLHKAMQNLNNVLGFLLDDMDGLTDEVKMKYLNVIKMLLYLYTTTVITIEHKLEMKKSETLQKGRKGKKNEEEFSHGFDRRVVLITFCNIILREINIFWDPPVVEESFVNMVGEAAYRFLESPSFKSDKESRVELFNMLGTLIKSYGHGMTFVLRIVQLIKMRDHLVSCIPEGIQILVQNYGCKSLIRDFVREITEWQTDEKYQDAQGARNCSNILFEMANLMPDLMIPEVMYLNRYLAHESYTLRNSVLHVISEVVLQVLTKGDLNDDQKESRDDFLAILEEHIHDVSAHVRCKVFQQWAKLQQENAIPLKIQTQILEQAVDHLRDKSALVRKCAAHCVTTFLSHNIYGAQLQLDSLQVELQQKQEILDKARQELDVDRLDKRREIEELWAEKEEKMREAIVEQLKEVNDEEIPESQISKKELPELMRVYVDGEKYVEAFHICRGAATDFPQWMEARNNLSEDEQINIFLLLIKAIYTDVSEDGNGASNINEEDLKKLETLSNTVEYLSDSVNFLTLINNAIKPMTDLLESASIGDMQEAIEFFIAAYQFNINNALVGVLEMLKIMQRNEKERKDLIINAFKTIYLVTDSTNLKDHTTTIVNRLIKLLQMAPFENILDLQLIMSEWVISGQLDNSVIDMLWQYFTKKIEVSDEESRAALHLLMMSALGRRTIASKNIKLVAAVGFGERGQKDLLLVAAACQMLKTVGKDKQDTSSTNPPFKIKADEPMWKDLVNILVANFNAKCEAYNMMMSEAVDCIYRLCSKPEKICEELAQNIINSLSSEEDASKDLKIYQIAQCVHMLGEITLKHLNFLDETVYKELKRRNFIREDRKNKKHKTKERPAVHNASAAKRKSKNSSVLSLQSFDDSITTEDTVLEGAQAEDADAEFIMNVLERHTVSKQSGLGMLAYIVLEVCERPDVYEDLYLQGTAVIALMRFMLVSSEFCEKHIQLLFTILERTPYSSIKSNILIHCSDLLERYPNIVEPWTPRLYERLKDSCIEVRTAALFMLSNLILRDMIRVQGHISEMACCIVDEIENIREMSRNFFAQLSRKANNLYNVLPDIFSHLCDQENLKEDNLRSIMKFLFGLIDKNKQMENLVDRFCSKFRLTDDAYKCRNIAFSLSLIQYNEKGLRRLQDAFPLYKNVLHDDHVYGFFKQILNTCSKSAKTEIKEISAEIEEKINSVFETDENGQPRANKPTTPASKAFKRPRGRAPKKKQKKNESESEDSDEGEKENLTPARNKNNKNCTPRATPTRQSARKRATRRGQRVDSDSDSD